MEIEKYTDINDTDYKATKDVKIKTIDAIKLENFRGIKNEVINLGKYVTVLAGKNGTMKSTMLGLISHPFSSPNEAKDLLGNPLKTTLSDVFRLSPEKDNDKYSYQIYLTTSKEEHLKETIRVWYYERENRFRIFVGKTNVRNKGNFELNTCYINLKRLFPMVDTEAMEEDSVVLTNEDKDFISNQYKNIFQRSFFKDVKIISQDKVKDTVGPNNTYYDYNTISSGEDNLGNLLIKLLAFKNNCPNHNDNLNGILCIDEIEASMHPVAQEKLFNVLYKFSKKYHIQIVFTTHSLYLIQHIFNEMNSGKTGIAINILSTQYVSEGKFRVIHNPDYKTAYKELTFRDENLSNLYKPNIIVEDKVAGLFFKRIIKDRKVLSNINLITDLSENQPGNSCTYLKSLLEHGEALLEDSIVIFDADVDVKKIKTTVPYFKFYDKDQYPLEKRIVKWIYDLDGSDEFFRIMNKEKNAFLSSFSDERINCLDDEEKMKDPNIDKYKKWVSNNDSLFKKCVTKYIEYEQESFDDFKKEVIEAINIKRRFKSLGDL